MLRVLPPSLQSSVEKSLAKALGKVLIKFLKTPEKYQVEVGRPWGSATSLAVTTVVREVTKTLVKELTGASAGVAAVAGAAGESVFKALVRATGASVAALKALALADVRRRERLIGFVVLSQLLSGKENSWWVSCIRGCRESLRPKPEAGSRGGRLVVCGQ